MSSEPGSISSSRLKGTSLFNKAIEVSYSQSNAIEVTYSQSPGEIT